MSAPMTGEAAAGSSPGRTAGAPGAAASSYGQILRSSALIGGASVVNVAVGIVRAKASALLLGPAGFGLMGVYGSIVDLAQSVAGMGLSGSGVRQIAAAAGSGETARVARAAAVLRRTSVVLGLVGAIALAALSGRIARFTFDGAGRAAPIALLSLAVLCRVVSDGRGALLQGLRRVSDLARVAVLGGVVGAGVGIALLALLRERGVAPALVAMAGGTLLFSWSYSRRVAIEPAPLRPAQVVQEAGALLKLGFAFMASGVLMMGAAYAVRMLVVRRLGFEAAGFYQSAWTVGGLYVGFILQAMGTDFYPRLAAVVRDRSACNRLVNEQARISLLLAGPGVLATLTFAPLVLSVFYSAEFGEAVGLLRWLCLGGMLRVITWPMGFIVVADARQAVFLALELAYSGFYVAAAWAGIRVLGVDGAGVAFLASYVFHGLIVYPVVRGVSGFRWSAANRRLIAGFLAVTGAVFCAFQVLPPPIATGLGALALAANVVYSLRTLARLVSADGVPPALRRALAWARRSPPDRP